MQTIDETKLPQIISVVINPLSGDCVYKVYDEQRPVGGDLCVTMGNTREEAIEKYREYRSYDGAFIVHIGFVSVPQIGEGWTREQAIQHNAGVSEHELLQQRTSA